VTTLGDPERAALAGWRRFAPALVGVALAFAACHSSQTVYVCQACFLDSPSDCGGYEGDCYGAYSHSMPARNEAEAKEMAAERACAERSARATTRAFIPGCALGPSFTDADRAANLARFSFQCSSHRKECP
jgi:hypothetical protein